MTQISSYVAKDSLYCPKYIVIVGGEDEPGQMLAQRLTALGHVVAQLDNGPAALRIIASQMPDLVVLDGATAGVDSTSLCHSLRGNPRTRRVPIIMLTEDLASEQGRPAELRADQYLHRGQPVCVLEMWVCALLYKHVRTNGRDTAALTTRALLQAIRAKDRYTEGHLQRMVGYATALGLRLGLSSRDMHAVRYGALLHDIGKLGIDEMIIRKGGPLTASEYRVMQQHPIIGERMVQSLPHAHAIAPIVRHHHERWDGRGYPDGLAGEAIPLGARIVAVADAFDAMTTQRPYNRVLSFDEAATRLKVGAGTCWDTHIVALFVQWLSSVSA